MRMRSETILSRILVARNPVLKAASSVKRKKKFLFHLYGTSSKPASSSLNSKLNLLSFLKNTSESILPAFWKSVNVSSSIINHVFSSMKKKSEKENCDKEEPVSISDNLQTSKSEAINKAVKDSETPSSSTQKKETEEGSYLEQAFFDWLSGRTAKESRKEFLEKDEKETSPCKKTLISKSSLQQRSRFLVHSLKDAVSPGSQLLRLEEVCKHLLLYPKQKREMCKAGLQPIVLYLKLRSNDEAVQTQARTVLALIGYPDPPRGAGIRILSIDGGGTRGMLAIEVLRQLEATTGKRVYELFDFICGVSSGAVLSVLLGGLHLTLDECEDLYRKLSDQVFSQSSIWGTGRLMWSHAYYDTTMWVNVLKKTFGEKLLIETSKCKNSPKIAAISAIMNLPQLQPFVFRNYDFSPKVQSHFIGSCQYRMWEAIRASGAAPGYFEEYSLDNYLHQDGGIMINNPTALGIHEAQLLWPKEQIHCVLSLGTGRFIPKTNSSGTSTSLKTKVLKMIDSATDTEGVHIILNDLLSPHTYFRINPYLTEFLGLDENRAEKLDQMKSDAQMYLRRNEYKFNSCAMMLCAQRSYYKRVKDWFTVQKDLHL